MTLVHQGGPMNDDEAATFEKLENFEAILRMRSWDEQAKVENMAIDPLDKYEAICKTYLNNWKST
jgi:predicted HD phosphohydrolase